MGSTHHQFNSSNNNNAHPHNDILLKVSKDSHLIKKSSSPKTPTLSHYKHHPPVIIYTHSPKVIHTNPQEFRALIQKLTGYTGSSSTTKNHSSKSPAPIVLPPPSRMDINNNQLPMMYYDDIEEFETKNVVALNKNDIINNNSISSSSLVAGSDDDQNINKIGCRKEAGCLGLQQGSYFRPNILDLRHQANSLPFFAPNYEDFYFPPTNNNNINQQQKAYNRNGTDLGNESDCYYVNDPDSSLEMSGISSMEAAIDVLADLS